MSVPKIVLDGSMPYGSRAITVNGTVYKMNNLSVTPTIETAQDVNTDGTPGRIRKTRGVRNWSGELQLASSSTARPMMGDTFTAQYDSNYGTETFVFDDVPHEEDNSATSIRVLKVSGHILLNPGSFSTVS